uniref:Peptidase M10 metallopeptidase domain-containing protein n=1 Tax=Panagrolaimus davidi TaxID=227884 RepID=A0A914PXB6_9BILA
MEEPRCGNSDAQNHVKTIGVPSVFDGVPGGVYAHGFSDGRLHFDGDENWRVYENGETPILEQTDLLWVAVHEIGHVLGLNHSHIVDSLMAPLYSSPEKRSITGYYSHPKITKDDIKTIQNIYGRKVAKAAKNGLKPPKECTEFCFI